jgi:hypothetical protein
MNHATGVQMEGAKFGELLDSIPQGRSGHGQTCIST